MSDPSFYSPLTMEIDPRDLPNLRSIMSLVVLAMLHSSFVADSVSVNKEAETDALLDWKVSLQNETQPHHFHGLSLLIMQPIYILKQIPHVEKYEVLSSGTLYDILFIKLPPHLNLAFMSNY